MTKYRDFDFEPRAEGEPIAFGLMGRKFQCRPEVPDMTLLRIVAKLGGDAPVQASALLDFFDSALMHEPVLTEAGVRETDAQGNVIPTDREQFFAFVEDPKTRVPVDALGAVVQWLVGEYTARPTSPPSA